MHFDATVLKDTSEKGDTLSTTSAEIALNKPRELSAELRKYLPEARVSLVGSLRKSGTSTLLLSYPVSVQGRMSLVEQLESFYLSSSRKPTRLSKSEAQGNHGADYEPSSLNFTGLRSVAESSAAKTALWVSKAVSKSV